MVKKIIPQKVAKKPVVKKINKIYPMPATDSGMVGEEHAKELQRPDIKSSRKLFDRFFNKFSGYSRAIDIAGGIGRVSRQILIPKFVRVDL